MIGSVVTAHQTLVHSGAIYSDDPAVLLGEQAWRSKTAYMWHSATHIANIKRLVLLLLSVVATAAEN
jgi:hypothetical protein